MLNLSSINNTIGQLDLLLGTVKNKLLNNPDTASVKLAEVLGELGKILDYLENEMVEYLGIQFSDDKSNLVENRIKLLSLESGFVTIKAYEARGHCHKIANIYSKYLDKWFSNVLNQQEASDVKFYFEHMNSADGDMIEAIHSLSGFLRDEASDVLELLDNDDIISANTRIKLARKNVQYERRQLVESLSRLKFLQASFIASSEVV